MRKIYKVILKFYNGEQSEWGHSYASAKNEQEAVIIVMLELGVNQINSEANEYWAYTTLYTVQRIELLGEADVPEGYLEESIALRLVGTKPRTLGEFMLMYPEVKEAEMTVELEIALLALIDGKETIP
ncbi:MAG: hypothetical protein ACYCX4_00115 [Bacillota bacterium]